MSSKWIKILAMTIYIAIGVVIAWNHGYLGLSWLRTLVSVVLSIVLWWLIPLGVNLHVH
jgi:hypothetical protein